MNLHGLESRMKESEGKGEAGQQKKIQRKFYLFHRRIPPLRRLVTLLVA